MFAEGKGVIDRIFFPDKSGQIPDGARLTLVVLSPDRVPGPAIRVKAPRPDRPASKSGFSFTGATPEGVANPTTPQFLFWQCREAALAALEAWEASAGTHTKWQGSRKKLSLRQDAGQDLNAFYDRASFSFFHQAVGGTTFFSGASTDVVAHELGHGLLDSVRPDFFDVNFLEVGAFHEGFGDCIAILTALGDKEMLAAMMPPLIIAPLRHVCERSFARRRGRATLLFIAGYMAVWMIAGVALQAVALAAQWAVRGPLADVALAAAVALLWQVSPAKQWYLNRCHRRPQLAGFGLAADRDAFNFGLTHGSACVVPRTSQKAGLTRFARMPTAR